MGLSLGQLLTAGLLFSAISFTTAVGLVVAQNLRRLESLCPAALAPLAIYGIATLATWLQTGYGLEMLVLPALGIATTTGAYRMLQNFTVAGQLLLATDVQLMLFGLLWGTWFIATIPIGTLTRALLFVGYPLLILPLPAVLVANFERWEVLCRGTWLRPRMPLPRAPRDCSPKVSLHVPVYSEPPEMVIATLDALAQLKYSNFEVLLIDNNTQDPGLWRPVETHCRHLGERFRFFHIDRLPGAKAGALNFALRQTAPDAELVGVIDSDYQAEPDFLERLVGFLDDPSVGFVQSPHDYREWQESLYQKMCYWEYEYHVKNTMAGLNERDAAYIIGTMCLIRRRALEEAGYWAEWCLTEDSELAIRIHALGYSGVYLTTTFGRGLIPESFLDYKRQRFRWTYGPIQQLKHHFRLFLPWPLGHPSALTASQRIHEVSHALEHLSVGLAFLLTLLGVAVITSMLLHGEVVMVPMPFWLAAFVFLAGRFALRWLVYRVVLGCSLRDNLGALIASKSLNYTVAMASLWGLFNHNSTWHRTNKFKVLPLGMRALSFARTELLLGLAMLLFGAGVLVTFPQPGLHFLLTIGVLDQSFTYLAAPVLALLAKRDVRTNRPSTELVRSRGDGPGAVTSSPDSL